MALVQSNDTTRLGSTRLVGSLLVLHSILLGYAFFLNYLRELIGKRKPPYDFFLPSPTEWRSEFRLSNPSSSFGDEAVRGAKPLIETNIEVLLKEGLFRLFSSDLDGYLAVSFLFYTLSSICICKALRGAHLAVSVSTIAITVLSYPSLLLLHRGDLFLVALPLLLYAFLLFDSRPLISAMMLGAACSISLQILVFVLVPCLLRSARVARTYVAITALTFLALSIGAFAVVGRYDLLISSEDNFSLIAEIFAPILIVPSSEPFNVATYGHSLFESLSVILGPFTLEPVPGLMLTLAAGATLFLVIIFLFDTERVSASSAWLVASCISCLFVPSSEDSRLLLLVPGLLALVKAPEVRRLDYILGFLIVVAMAPKPWGYIGWYPWANAAHWLTPVSLVAVLTLNSFRILFPRKHVALENEVS